MTLLPLHRLLLEGREPAHRVSIQDATMVRWEDFARRVAAHAAAYSATAEKRWLLCDAEPLDFAVRLLALLHAGKHVLIPPNTQPGTLELLQGEYDRIAYPVADQAAVFDFQPLPDNCRLTLYTSGSTGEPKKIHKSLKQLEQEVQVLESLWGSLMGERPVLASAPHHHIYGLLFRLLWPLSAGRPFDTLTCSNPEQLAGQVAQWGACTFVSSPAQLSRLPDLMTLQDVQPAPFPVFSSGGPLANATALALAAGWQHAPLEVLGSTETGGIAWRTQQQGDAWTAFPGVKITCDNTGSASLHSPFLPDAAPYAMPDLIEPLDDGTFKLLGRADRIVKIEEKRLSLPEMEARLAQHPWVQSAALVTVQSRRLSVGAALVLSEEGHHHLEARGRQETARELRQFLTNYFDAVLLPRRWRFIPALPLNERGKLVDAAMQALFASGKESHAAA